MTDELRLVRYNPEVVRIFFENYHEFLTYVQRGDPSHVEVWVDINDAITDADLLDQELSILYNYYVDYMSIEELTAKHGYTRRGIESVLRRTIVKITNVLSDNFYDVKDVKLRTKRRDNA